MNYYPAKSFNAQSTLIETSLEEFNLANFLFKITWLIGLLALLLDLGRNLNLGNVNNIEKSLFLIASLIFVYKNPINKLVLVGYGLVGFSIFFFAALTQFSEFSWGRVSLAYAALISLLNFFLARPSQEDRTLILHSIVCAAPFIVLYGVVLFVVLGKPLHMKDHTGAVRLGGASIPAFLAAAAYCSSIAAASLFMCTRKPLYIALVFICLFISIMSGSRMPTVCAAISSFTILFAAIKNWSTRAGFAILGLSVMAVFLLTLGDQILLRFMSHSSSGRESLWAALIQWINYFPWFGVGFGHHQLLIPSYVTQMTGTVAPHNEYIRLSAELGYPGAGLFILGIILLFFFATTHKKATDIWITLVVISVHLMYCYSDNVFFMSYCFFGPMAYAMSSGLTLYSPAKD